MCKKDRQAKYLDKKRPERQLLKLGEKMCSKAILEQEVSQSA